MRILAFSDIHNNMPAVRKLRAQESNSFDAIVVAGDIGGESVGELHIILQTFECPSFVVYGNWDHEVSYDAHNTDGVNLIHHSVERLGQYLITGFSGCVTHWGMNPEYGALITDLRARHSEILARVEDVKRIVDATVQEAQSASEHRLAEQVERLSKRTVDKRRAEYRRKLKALHASSDLKLDKDIERSADPIRALVSSPAYVAYRADRRKLEKLAQVVNREKLNKVLEQIDCRRTVIVTHERLFRLSEGRTAPLLHVFGHRHTYKHTLFEGTHLLNVAALDRVCALTSIQDPDDEDVFHANLGGYCVVTLKGDQVEVERRSLIIDHARWQSHDFSVGDTFLPDEQEFARLHSPYRLPA